MPRALLVVPLLVVLVAAFRLTRAALRRWRDLRAAQTYELPVDQRPLLLQAGGAALCLMCAMALTVAVALDGRGARSSEQARASASVTPAGVTPKTAPAAPVPPPPVVTRFDSIGHPAGGELFQGAVAGPDGHPRAVRVWLPPEYRADDRTRFSVIVLDGGTAGKTADTELPDVFEGFTSATKLGRARPFIVVAAAAPNGTQHPCELVAAAPQAVADDAALRTAVGAAFRTRSAGPDSWGVLGVEGGAPCAAAAGLARQDLYGAAAAVSGRYDPAALTQTAAAGNVRLMLAAAKGDAAGLDSARKLQAALHAAPGPAAQANVRISDAVQDFTPERERQRLVRVAVQYLAETLPA